MPALASSLGFLLRSLADFAFPPLCFGCDTETDGRPVCETCKLRLFTSEMEVCPRCGRAHDGFRTDCGHCSPPISLKRIRALGRYAEPFIGLIHFLKYSEKTRLGLLLGSALANLLSEDAEMRQADALCAVPLHPARIRERGFNQSLLLAKTVSDLSGIPLIDPVVRCKYKPSQTQFADPDRRWRNVARVFEPRPGTDLAGRTLILIDDVTTTGATLDAVTAQLLKVGASAVFGLVVAAARPQEPQSSRSAGRGSRRTMPDRAA
jgi:ComF family protein